MKIILLQDEKKLGKKGDIIEANDGFARNYILPKKIGIEATGKNLNDLKLQKANSDKLAAQQLQEAKDLAALLETKKVMVEMKAGENGKAFGALASKEIAAAAKEQCGLEIDKKKIQLADPIKTFGMYEVKIKLHPQVTGTLKVEVKEV